jgi:hypothetical protein
MSLGSMCFCVLLKDGHGSFSREVSKKCRGFVLLPPDARQAVDLLIETRALVGVPATNPYIFARLSVDTPLTGHTELQEIAQSCPGIKYPERTSTNLQKYIATVSQVRFLFS